LVASAPAGTQRADDPAVKHDETLWRLIAPHWYPADPSTGRRAIDEAAFAHNREVSALRSSLVSEAQVKGRFPDHGIAELPVGEVRKAGCVIQIKDDPSWPPQAHAVIKKAPDGTRLKPAQIAALTRLANANLRLAPNVP